MKNNDLVSSYYCIIDFIDSLATICMSLNNEPCIARTTLINLNPLELNDVLFMIILDKCNGSCKTASDLSKKLYVPGKTKDVDVKVFNLITRIYEAKTSVKYIPCDCKSKSNSTTCNSNQRWNNDKCNASVKNNYNWNPSTCICEK